MQKKFWLVIYAMTILWCNFALAQSTHHAIYGSDPDLHDKAGGKFEIASVDGKYKLGFKGHLQENNQFSYAVGDKSNRRDNLQLNIELKRARFTIYGSAFDPSLTFLFQTAFERDQRKSDSKDYRAPGSDYLRDYYVNFAPKHKYYQLRVGKFRTPFSRQQLMSTSQMQFYDQHHANDSFQTTDSGRDVGIMAHNGWNNQFEWAVAAVSHGLVLRAGYNYNQIDGYDMVDWSGGNLRFAVAANGFMHSDYTSAKLDDLRGGVDFVVKVAGFSTNGALYYQRKKAEKQDAQHRFGAGLDAGYLIKGKFEPALRYSLVKFEEPRVVEHEILAGFNYYIHGHHLKLQAYGGPNLLGKDIATWTGGVQFQFAL